MAVRIRIQQHDLKTEMQRAANFKRRSKGMLFQELRDTSLELMGVIRVLMPKDTGRAFRSWGVEIWNEDEAALSIEQGSKVHYIKYLNEGWSKQAPAGFIDSATESAVDDLINRLLNRTRNEL